MLPQRQTTVGSSTTWMWPTSPALPWAPRCRRPSEMIPAPIPVPTLTTTTLSWPAATPVRHSPRARTLTSLSTQTGRAVALGEALADRVAVPAGHDRRRDRAAGPELDGAGHADADAPQRPGDAAVVRGERVEQLVDAGEARLRAGRDAGRLGVVGEDAAVEVGDRDIDAGGAEVGDEDVAGVGPEGQLARRPAAGARARRRPRTRPRSISSPTRWATIARPSPVRVTSSERERDLPEPDLVEDGDERVERFVGQWPAAVERRIRRAADRYAASCRSSGRLLHLTGQSTIVVHDRRPVRHEACARRRPRRVRGAPSLDRLDRCRPTRR